MGTYQGAETDETVVMLWGQGSLRCSEDSMLPPLITGLQGYWGAGERGRLR